MGLESISASLLYRTSAQAIEAKIPSTIPAAVLASTQMLSTGLNVSPLVLDGLNNTISATTTMASREEMGRDTSFASNPMNQSKSTTPTKSGGWTAGH